jgi:hypothetical protein
MQLRTGSRIGPAFEAVEIGQPSVLVFVDEKPTANFAHDCAYLLYDVEGRPLKQVRANFPPYDLPFSRTLKLFHEPVPVTPQPVKIEKATHPPCPPILPIGRRYAILFAGILDPHHLNDVELCYRTLKDDFGLRKQDIYVLLHDGKKDPDEGVFADGTGHLRKYPGTTPTSFRITPHAAATGEEMRKVFEHLSTVIKAEDLLFIYTDGHGGTDLLGQYLRAYEDEKYYSADLRADLQRLKNHPYRSLLVMMNQCFAGGFENDVMAGSTAKDTYGCWAANPIQQSHWAPGHNFCQFTLDWIAGQRRKDVLNSPVPSDKNNDSAIEAQEAFNYANLNPHADETPGFSKANGGPLIAFTDPNPTDDQWCMLMEPVLEEYWRHTPEPLFYEKLHTILPELQEAVLPVLVQNTRHLAEELLPRIRQILAKAFGRKPPRTVPAPSHRTRGHSMRVRRR